VINYHTIKEGVNSVSHPEIISII